MKLLRITIEFNSFFILINDKVQKQKNMDKWKRI